MAETTAAPPTTQAVTTIADAVTTTEAPGTTADAATTTAAPATTQAATSAPELRTFSTSDGLTLEGTLFGDGDVAVVLGAMGLSTMETWFPFAQFAADHGFTAFAYNMRGHGASGGDQFPFRVDVDALAAIDFVQSEGHDRVFFFGASVNGVGAIAAAAEENLAGVVSLSGIDFIDGVDAVALAPDVDEPKLFIVASGDGTVPGLIQLVFDASGDPRNLTVLDGDAHGTDLFEVHGEQLFAMFLDFLTSN